MTIWFSLLFFESQEDEDGHIVVLNILEEIMLKTKSEFLEHFARLGVFSKVQALMDEGSDSENSSDAVIKSPEVTKPEPASSDESNEAAAVPSTSTTNTGESESKAPSDGHDDAKEILQGRAYHWRDWSVCRGRDCLYVWSDSAALELSNGSNGWFRFILDGKLATMYSSGSPENGNDNSGKQTGKPNSKFLSFLALLFHIFASVCVSRKLSSIR